MKRVILVSVTLLPVFGSAAIAECMFNIDQNEIAVADCPTGSSGECRYKDDNVDIPVSVCPHSTAERYVVYAGEAWKQKDVSAEIHWYRMAATLGNARAEFALGNVYYLGLGVPKDVSEAIRWYRKAADQGEAMAQKTMGDMCWRGESVPKDAGEALRWYRKAAAQGDGDAQYAIDGINDEHHARNPLPANGAGIYPIISKKMPPDDDCKGIRAHRCYLK
jgi:TPR repeat protein